MHILYIMDIIHDNGYIMDMQWTCISYSSVSSLSKTGSGLHVGNPPGGPRWLCGGSLEWNAVEAIASGRGALSHDRRHPLQTLRQNYAIAAATPWDFHGDLMEFLMGLLGYMMGYPPVMTNRLLLKMAIYSEFSHYKRWVSMAAAMWNYQRPGCLMITENEPGVEYCCEPTLYINWGYTVVLCSFWSKKSGPFSADGLFDSYLMRIGKNWMMGTFTGRRKALYLMVKKQWVSCRFSRPIHWLSGWVVYHPINHSP